MGNDVPCCPLSAVRCHGSSDDIDLVRTNDDMSSFDLGSLRTNSSSRWQDASPAIIRRPPREPIISQPYTQTLYCILCIMDAHTLCIWPQRATITYTLDQTESKPTRHSGRPTSVRTLAPYRVFSQLPKRFAFIFLVQPRTRQRQP